MTYNSWIKHFKNSKFTSKLERYRDCRVCWVQIQLVLSANDCGCWLIFDTGDRYRKAHANVYLFENNAKVKYSKRKWQVALWSLNGPQYIYNRDFAWPSGQQKPSKSFLWCRTLQFLIEEMMAHWLIVNPGAEFWELWVPPFNHNSVFAYTRVIRARVWYPGYMWQRHLEKNVEHKKDKRMWLTMPKNVELEIFTVSNLWVICTLFK